MMILIKIILGLIGLGVVVFVHELGHFIAARAVGITVDAFSIGWGTPIWKKKIGAVEYRIGMFPIGGYCKMAGDNDFKEAWENNRNAVNQKEGTFFGAKPWRRIITAFAGPFFNIIFAALVFAIIWGAGFEYRTMDNRIVLLRDIDPSVSSPADRAGLETGDRIRAIDGRKIDNYSEVQRIVATSAEKRMRFTIDRGGKTLALELEPELQKESGAGMIGIFAYTEPIVGSIQAGSPAAAAGLCAGDRILSINGQEIAYTAALYRMFKDGGELPSSIPIEYERGDALFSADIQMPDGESEGLGIEWQSVLYHTPDYSIFGAIAKGVDEAYWTLATTVRSFRLLFRGIDLTQSVSGPARITWMVGDIAASGFGQSFSDGLRSLGNFLALISIALGVTNLLPLPVLDGGLIILFIVEILHRKPLHPKVVQAFQTAGVVIIAGLMLFAIAGDILFFAGK
ncbi:MAG: RIP metalloprotease RseP [Spirochaetaceae bacterium]|nr:RIP metalloprotease RseP [Spirochaetaceae bacterium]